MFTRRRILYCLFAFLLLCGFVVRLYRFDNPIADWHSWRQADTASVSRNFLEEGLNPLYPTYEDISNIQSGKDNPKGYRMVEFPLYNIKHAAVAKLLPVITFEQAGRLVSIISSLFTAVLFYLLVRRYAHKEIAILTSFFYLFLPFNIYYNRTILPDTMMVTASIAGIYFFDIWIRCKRKNRDFLLFFFLSVISTAAAFLLKPYSLFFTLPMLYIAYQRYNGSLFKRWELYLFAVLSLIPFIGWRMWINQFPEGIPANIWLLNGNGIRFRPSFFRWIGYERLTKLILGYIGIVFPLLSIFVLRSLKNAGFYISFALASILYVVVFATGNVQHDYYQILIMPTISLFCALGAYALLRYKYRYIGLGVLIVLMSGTFYFGWMQVRDYFNINNEVMVRVGQEANKILPQNALVIAPYGGDTTFLYHINRKGWPSFQASTEELIELGASHAVILSPSNEDRSGWAKNYKILRSTPDSLIIKLR